MHMGGPCDRAGSPAAPGPGASSCMSGAAMGVVAIAPCSSTSFGDTQQRPVASLPSTHYSRSVGVSIDRIRRRRFDPAARYTVSASFNHSGTGPAGVRAEVAMAAGPPCPASLRPRRRRVGRSGRRVDVLGVATACE